VSRVVLGVPTRLRTLLLIFAWGDSTGASQLAESHGRTSGLSSGSRLLAFEVPGGPAQCHGRSCIRRASGVAPKPSWLDIRHCRQSLCEAAMAGAAASLRLPFVLLKVSGANETGEPNGEPTTTTIIRRCRATSSHGPRW
jgi:hypothetical protein